MNTSVSTHANTETPAATTSSRRSGNSAGEALLLPVSPARPASRTPEDKFRQAHAEGLTNYEIAARFGLSYASVRQRLSRLGLKANPLTGTAIAETRRLHSEGLTPKEIARAADTTHTAVLHHLRVMGIKANRKHVSDEEKAATRRARIERASEARRQRKARHRAMLLRTAFMHDACPVSEEMLGQVMARLVAASQQESDHV